MKISLIVATVGRDKEVGELLTSLSEQEYKNFEVIIIDQNKDDRLYKYVKKYESDIRIIHIKSSKLGISYNRNLGLENVSGEIIAFTDDDCTYDKKLLNNVIDDFLDNDINFISYRIIDKEKNKYLAKFPNNRTNIYFNNLFITMSASIFINTKNINIDCLKFDEKLGIGSEFGSCEDVDLIFSMLNNNYKGIFIPRDLIYHPVKDYPNEVGYKYGMGLGAFVKKTIINYKKYNLVLLFLKENIKACIGIIVRWKRRGYYLYTLKGRINGFIKYN